MEKKNYIHDFIFHFNTYTSKWNAVTRDNYNELFSGDKGNVISSSSIQTLEYLINKYQGDVNKIKSNVK